MTRRRNRSKANHADLPAPPIPPNVDLRDVPIPINAFIDLAMDQFGMDRETATRLVLESVAERYGAKGVA